MPRSASLPAAPTAARSAQRPRRQRDLCVALYSVVGGTWNYIGGPPGSFLSQVALARDAGVNLVSFSAPNCWTPPEKPIDWAPLDDLCRQIIAVNPKVLLVPRVGADAPDWWLQRNPEARMVYDGDKVVNHSCVSDRAYRADVCAHLEKISRHLLETFPDRFAGIHPCGQNTGEWFYLNSWARPLSGYDPATRAAFRQWLKSHGDPQADTAEPPTADERRAHPNGLLRDPAREKRLLDFARFQQQEMADHVAAMAAACRRGTDGRKLVVFFYGYLFEFAPLPNGAPTSGHYALSSLLKGRDIDILCSPISYTDREWIGTAPSMTAAESVARAGILWLNEDDSRTFLDPRKEEHVQEGGLVDLEQTRQVMRRNTAQAAIRGFGTWWMDLPAQGWFNDARIWEEMVLLRPRGRRDARAPRALHPGDRGHRGRGEHVPSARRLGRVRQRPDLRRPRGAGPLRRAVRPVPAGRRPRRPRPREAAGLPLGLGAQPREARSPGRPAAPRSRTRMRSAAVTVT